MKKILLFSFSLLIIFTISCKKEPTEVESYPPVLSNLSAYPASLNPGESTMITAEVSEFNGDKILYSWEADYGTPSLLDSSPSTSFTWTSPDTPGTYFINCTVSDKDGSRSGCILIPVGDTIRLNYNISTINPLPANSKMILSTIIRKNTNFTNNEDFSWSTTQDFTKVIDSNGRVEFRFINKSIPGIGGIIISKTTFNDGITNFSGNSLESTILAGRTIDTNVFLGY